MDDGYYGMVENLLAYFTYFYMGISEKLYYSNFLHHFGVLNLVKSQCH